ncbi:hypothetical protein QBC33DRAFT_569131 [Phialemonium atrogriseum]|uniref:DUF7770 domain-containing protein n=1 Tax=Phialemonium atrogriseum TaxID=1093897 RepID=A0AAJ0FMP6_9PEZI|nr:uncharacterized protein QBC33DRAFT_569131 [Phialemonium atrogriseum]KAK1768089.1 hypothetical protein QBC33DRAFT_569131 [Phialemonium atrogriseum]
MGNCCSFPSSRGSTSRSHLESHEMHEWDPLNYIPPCAEPDIRSPNRIVSAGHFIAHSVLQSGGNHWQIYLQTGKDESVCLELVPGAFPGQEGFLGRFDIVLHGYGLTRNTHKTVSISAVPGRSVADFLDAIIANDNHRYEFTQDGRGCTGWVLDQFHLFMRAGLLPPGREHDLEEAVNTAWEDGRSRGPRAVTLGTYVRDRGGGRRGVRRRGGGNR